MLLLGLLFALMTLVFLAILGGFAGLISNWLHGRPHMGSRISMASGLMLILLGGRLLLSQHHSG